MEQTSIYLGEILDDLLEWGLVQSKQFPYRPESLDIRALVEQTFLIYQATANDKEIELRAVIEGTPRIWGDQRSLLTIFRNLLSNALKFSKPGGKVTFLTRIEKKSVIIEVRDTGVGVPPDKIDDLFSMTQGPTSGTLGEKGTGLGLNLCKELVQLNHGEISVESQASEGTVFTLLFPVLEL